MADKMSEKSPLPPQNNLSPFILSKLRGSDHLTAYKRKLSNFGLCDPYLLPNSVTKHIMQCESLPSLEFHHIYLYFINSPSPYTGKEHQAHKSMEAFNYTVSGKVLEIRVWKNELKDIGSTYLFLSKVSV